MYIRRDSLACLRACTGVKIVRRTIAVSTVLPFVACLYVSNFVSFFYLLISNIYIVKYSIPFCQLRKYIIKHFFDDIYIVNIFPLK